MQFVEWSRAQIDKGSVIVAGFYDKQLSDLDYDHIMPVVGYKKDAANKTLGLFYNDLWVTTGPRYLSASTDILSRSSCQVASPLPQPHPYCIPSGANFAIALQGNVDEANETERMKLIIPQNNEPDWGDEDKLNETPINMNISGKIVGLT